MKTKLETLRDKEAQLKQQINDLERRERDQIRKQDERKRFIVGGAIMQAVDQGALPQRELSVILDKFIVAKPERKLFDIPEQRAEDMP